MNTIYDILASLIMRIKEEGVRHITSDADFSWPRQLCCMLSLFPEYHFHIFTAPLA